MVGNEKARSQAGPSKVNQPDPRALLSPKANASPYLNTVGSMDSSNGSQGGKRPFPKNPLEEIYGVEERTEPRQKKARIEPGPEAQANGKKASFSHSTNGVVGAYMREPQENGGLQFRESIDLTKESGDDEIVITGARVIPPAAKSFSPEDEEVCLGRLDMRINAFKIPCPRAKSIFQDDKVWPTMSCQLSRVRSPNDRRIAVLGNACMPQTYSSAFIITTLSRSNASRIWSRTCRYGPDSHNAYGFTRTKSPISIEASESITKASRIARPRHVSSSHSV